MSFLKTISQTLESTVFALQENLSREGFIEQIQKAASQLSSAKRIVVTGMGKSGLIARKVAATLTSTGTPAVFLHPADALHGDIGHIGKCEMILAYSNSGETREIIELLPHIRLLGGKLIAISGNSSSTVVKEADTSIIYEIKKEGCPLELAPMASTTISLAIGDAIAAALIHIKKFKAEDFSRFHPSGSLGKKLLTKVKDISSASSLVSSGEAGQLDILVTRDTSFHDIVKKMVTTNLGAVMVVGSKGHLRGIITDGDIKRHLDSHHEPNQHSSLDILWKKNASEIMTPDPAYAREDALIEQALKIMHEKKTYILPVLKKDKKPVGVVRMHDLLGFQ